MEKTETMKRYEADTGFTDAIVMVKIGFAKLYFPSLAYVQWFEEQFTKSEAKATAYDNLVSKTIISDAELDAPLAQRILREMCEKAEAYDRLMSGEGVTKKEVANIFGKVLVMTPNGYWQLWFSKPKRNRNGWSLHGGDTKSIGHTIAHFSDLNIIHDGDWKDSLALPDGREEK